MKRIAIFCDGTWNAPAAGRETHVERLAKAVRPVDDQGVVQQVLYYPGVGQGRGPTFVNRAMDRYLGGAFGFGLIDNIKDAFRDIILNFTPGDELYLFGFSRGAYTARSLAGLMRTAGIPERDELGSIEEAVAEYMRRGLNAHPDTEAVKRFRASISPDVATSSDDIIWRKSRGYGDAAPLKIDYMGMFDTVGGLGLPGVLGLAARLYNRRFAFHDTDLSRSVHSARHAVAIDERRRLYPPTLWGNLDKLNGETTGAERPFQQLWFPGVHSTIGGNSVVPALSAQTFLWIAEGAAMKGLEFDADELVYQGSIAKVDAAAQGFNQAGLLSGLPFLMADRDGPDRAGNVSQTARQRIQALPSYRPGTLRRVLDQLT